MGNRRDFRTVDLAVLGIVLVGAVLRIWGIGFGLPIESNLYIRPDESLLIEPGLHFFERWGDPLFYVYPALVIDFAGVLFKILFQVWQSLGLASGDGMLADFAAAPSAYFLAIRWISVIAGTATVYVVFKLGQRLSGSRAAALAAAFLYAVAPLAVRDAHFGVTDNVMVLFLSLSLLAGIGYVQRDESSSRSPVQMGAWFGLAAASKYTAFLLGPRLVAAVLLRKRGSERAPLLKGIAAVTLLPAALFLALNPYVIPNLRTAFHDLLDILRIFYLWQPGDPPWTLREAILQVLRPLRFGPGGLAGVVLCGLGAWFGLRAERRIRSATILLAGYLGLHILALIPFRHLVPYRYLLPILPLIAVFAGLGLGRLMERSWPVAVRVAAGFLLLFCLSTTLYRSVQVDAVLAEADTRNLAGDWIEAHVPQEVPVVVLCPPEAEPQVYEHRDSLIRRTQYVARRYGVAAGRFISRLYLDQLADPRRSAGGWQLFRFPDPEDPPDRVVALVTCDHPLRMGRTPVDELERWQGTVLESSSFTSCTGAEKAAWDWIDAWFVPLTELEKVERPGPNIEVRIMDRGANRH
ncbi:MAG: glycosyltransferase family 39 protein [Acidobacteriota bacterium]